mgnify:CR=1 FL=1
MKRPAAACRREGPAIESDQESGESESGDTCMEENGEEESDFERPFIGIANSYTDLIPGHVHLQEFGKIAKQAIREAGGVPFEFNTIGVDDGIAMGHIGMRYSLPSRELIADSV